MKNKYTTIGIILTTIILAGVAIFTALRLYQTREVAVAPNVPSSMPAAQETNVCSLSFTVGATQTVSCTSLTSNVASPRVGQSITGTCKGTFSSSVTSPVARFGVNLNGTPLGLSNVIPLSPTGASYTVTVPTAGNYVVQCQICTDSTLSNCTTMEPVASSASCRLSFNVGGTSTATATATSTTRATATATATSTATSTATTTATATSTTVASATPTASPVPQCNNSCTSNSNCPSGLMCYIASGATSGMCRNTQCLSETDCTCAVATSTSTSVAQAPAPTNQPTLPVVGTRWPTILGTGFGILVIIGSLLLAL